MDSPPEGINTMFEYRTVYRYRDNLKETMESPLASVNGWTQYDIKNEYGDWSEWSDNPITSTSTKEVETKQVQDVAGHMEYRYGRWMNSRGVAGYCAEYSESFGGSCEIQYSDWSSQRLTYMVRDWTCGCSDSQHPRHTNVDHYTNDGRAWWKEYEGDWFWEESRWINTTYITQYRFRNILTTYCYYRWVKGDWSSWGEYPYEPNGNSRDVETKTQCRYMII